MEMKPKLFISKVMHKRLFPKVNAFTYGIYYLAFPLSKISELNIPRNKSGIMSFYDKDHGYKDGSNIAVWVKDTLKQSGIECNGEVILVTLPRILGYVFNPISFYFCFDELQNLKVVICEVNNTFSETHSYICVNKNGETIRGDQWLSAEKVFHVSPFLEREGRYQFRFNIKDKKLGIWIDYFDRENRKKLITSLVGNFEEINKFNLCKAFFKYPLITFKAIFLIHFEAVKLLLKRMAYIKKPNQNEIKITITK